jgi:hypothetical protein
MSYKSVLCYGVLAKKEASYAATNTTLASPSDSVLVSDLPSLTINYVYDGSRPATPSTAGVSAFSAPSGRNAEVSLVIEARGSGSAYTSATTTPPDVHALLQSCGFSGSYSGSRWTYEPVGPCDTGESVAVKLFSRGEIYTMIGGRSNVSLASDGASPATYTFTTQGLLSGSVVDGNVATIAYNQTLPPKTENIQLVLGTFLTAIVRSFSLDLAREINPRLNINAVDSHAGFAGARRTPTFNVTIEIPTLSVFNIYELQRNATQFAASFEIGAVAGNILDVELPNCQITGISVSEDGAVSTADLTITPSSVAGAADIRIMYR